MINRKYFLIDTFCVYQICDFKQNFFSIMMLLMFTNYTHILTELSDKKITFQMNYNKKNYTNCMPTKYIYLLDWLEN